MRTSARKRGMVIAAVCVSLLVLGFGRNYATGARINLGEPVYVMEVGEQVNYHTAPNRYMPSNYVRIDRMTWFSWGGESSWGFGRLSEVRPGEVFGADSAWARIEVSCPMESDGEVFYSKYEMEWVGGGENRSMDGWEDGEVKLVEGECLE